MLKVSVKTKRLNSVMDTGYGEFIVVDTYQKFKNFTTFSCNGSLSLPTVVLQRSICACI